MPQVIFISPDGTQRAIEVPVGWSVMEAAVQNDVSGIVAECGGGCACATCHVIVDPTWQSRLPASSAHENDMLECTAVPREPTSRLSCQIKMSAELDGLQLQLPSRQS